MKPNTPSGPCAATPFSPVSQPDSTDLHIVTVDLADGQPCPPFIEDGIPWRVVQRRKGRTLWCRGAPRVLRSLTTSLQESHND
jgi:hypothetical protein